jgi:hypothetical protein
MDSVAASPRHLSVSIQRFVAVTVRLWCVSYPAEDTPSVQESPNTNTTFRQRKVPDALRRDGLHGGMCSSIESVDFCWFLLISDLDIYLTYTYNQAALRVSSQSFHRWQIGLALPGDS